MVERALTEVSWSSPVEVRLNPEDMAVAEAHFIAIEDDAKPPRLEWTPDSNVDRGGYIVETLHRLVDGTLDTVLNNLHEQLAND
jgi:flagellar biosynthesis/type III secretory pathway protein FliH